MKMLHVVTSLDPAQGGLSAVALRLAAAQKLLGHRAAILTQDAVDQSRAFHAAHAVKAADSIPRFSVPPPSRWDSLAGGDSLHGISTALAETDVVHLHGLWDPLLFCVAKAARRMGKPYVVAPHGMVDPWSLAQKRWKKRLALAWRYRAFLNGAVFIQALNGAEATFIRNLGVVSPVETIANGIFLDEVDGDGETGGDYFQERFGWPGSMTLLFLGRLHWKKGLDILADAFAQLADHNPEARLVVAGPDDGQRVAFVRKIGEYGLSDRVSLPGPIYGREKYRALRSAAMFVLPSRQEGFSIAILEALASQTPVVITENCHFPEVGANAAGIVADLSPARHAAAYRDLLEDPDRARRLGIAGRELVAQRYTWEAIARRSVALYAKHGNRGVR